MIPIINYFSELDRICILLNFDLALLNALTKVGKKNNPRDWIRYLMVEKG